MDDQVDGDMNHNGGEHQEDVGQLAHTRQPFCFPQLGRQRRSIVRERHRYRAVVLALPAIHVVFRSRLTDRGPGNSFHEILGEDVAQDTGLERPVLSRHDAHAFE